MDLLNLLSALLGAIIGQAILIVWEIIKGRRGNKSLLRALSAECRYSLSILDELKNGAVNHRGSFKRLSVDFFRSARDRLSVLGDDAELIRLITVVCTDMDLYNLELSYVFNGTERAHIVSGLLKDDPVCLRLEPELHNITPTILAATEGVRGSLQRLLAYLNPKETADE